MKMSDDEFIYLAVVRKTDSTDFIIASFLEAWSHIFCQIFGFPFF